MRRSASLRQNTNNFSDSYEKLSIFILFPYKIGLKLSMKQGTKKSKKEERNVKPCKIQQEYLHTKALYRNKSFADRDLLFFARQAFLVF